MRKSYLMTAFLVATTLVAGCASGPPSRQAQTSAADQVVDDYKVVGMLSQAGPAISDSLSRNLPASVSSDQKQRLNGALAKAYEPQRLRSAVVDRVGDAAAASDHQSYLIKAAANLEKPLPQRMIKLESKVSDPGFGKGFKAFVNEKSGPARQQRLDIVKGLADDMAVTDLQLQFNLSLLKSVIKARNAVVPADQQVGSAQRQRILSNSRDGIRAKLDQQVPQMLLYVYRDVTTDTLKQYARLQHQPEMVWTNQAVADAVTASLSDAGDRLTQNFNAKD